ncbi:hypothetical protein AVEN_163179-1 [Araneus ventricosus]|uniref:Ig-like domain-containing protein n=1 Tax=Araneus ventricosus TaxID=182803 RepID=A0A4Y2TZY3_ARAVE|nr:hypothetical protein AVEN_163179-1 [Araneus ventricosus]
MFKVSSLQLIGNNEIEKTFLTCEVPFKSRNFSEIEDQLHYVWFKDEIPISVDSPVLNLSSYPEPVKQISSYAIRQGTYSCVVTVEGLVDSFSSESVNIFLGDWQTYIVYMQAGLKSVLDIDFSESESFYALMRMINNSMNDVIRNTTTDNQWLNLECDYQMSWKNEENVTVQLLLYTRRSWNVTEIKKDFKKNLLPILSYINSTVSLEIGVADACFEQAVPSSSTSYNVTFLWRETGQTKSLLSEPVCLKGKLSLPLFDFISTSDISQLILL